LKAQNVLDELQKLADPDIAEHSQRFFKTGPDEYGEGDQFFGIRVPVTRNVAAKFNELPLQEICRLLSSEYHEARLCALIILVNRFKKGDKKERESIYQLYLKNTRFINNWDLVDTSAHQILGSYLQGKDREPLYELAKSEDLWERRIAVISTFYFIKNDDFETTLKIAEQLLNDNHDLIHKAVGWMLRKIGERDMRIEEQFLQKHVHNMPRTMLRYAIEKFPEAKRKRYLAM